MKKGTYLNAAEGLEECFAQASDQRVVHQHWYMCMRDITGASSSGAVLMGTVFSTDVPNVRCPQAMHFSAAWTML